MPNFQQEFLASCADDAKHLLDLHWQEIAINKQKIKLNPHWDAYQELEKENQLRIYTARENQNLVGYFVLIIGMNLHYKDHVFAVNDVLYLHKDWRRGLTGVKLVKFAEKCLKKEGVSVMTINTKTHRPFDKLMEYLKYNMVERVYQKYIGD